MTLQKLLLSLLVVPQKLDQICNADPFVPRELEQCHDVELNPGPRTLTYSSSSNNSFKSNTSQKSKTTAARAVKTPSDSDDESKQVDRLGEAAKIN